MSAKHTPGPWVYVENKYDSRRSVNIRAIVNGDSILIAQVGTEEVNEEEKANARLISLVPNMYKLLSNCQAIFKSCHMDVEARTIEKFFEEIEK